MAETAGEMRVRKGTTPLSLVLRRAPNRVFCMIMLDAMSGVLSAMIIPVILSGIAGGTAGGRSSSEFQTVQSEIATVLSVEVANSRYAVLFGSLVLLILITRSISRIVMQRVLSMVTSEMRINMYRQLVQAPVVDVERVGPGRLMAALTDDVPKIVQAARLLPVMLSSAATLCGLLLYLAYLNPHVLRFVIEAIAFGLLTHQLLLRLSLRFMQRRRELIDTLHRSIRALIQGFRELKLDQRKRAAFLEEYLFAHERGVRDADTAGYAVGVLAGTYGELIGFAVIGIVGFVFVNYHSVSGEDLIAIVITLMYITTPVAAILNSLPDHLLARVALRKMAALFAEIRPEPAREVYAPGITWSRIRFEEVVFQYDATEHRSASVVGPVSFECAKGEIALIAGGNGSGKSTLAKLLTLHYKARSGRIFFGDTLLSDENVNVIRQQVGFIYSDYYLFEGILGQRGAHLKSQVDRWLRELELDADVSFDGERFSTVRLSDGQRRRLALLVAILEDKELYLFDEWAADQDPSFKQVFYHRLVPELKRRGKLVVIVSHDERYFDIADKLLVMEDGRLLDAKDVGSWRGTLGTVGRRSGRRELG